jgi:hypothetical protein
MQVREFNMEGISKFSEHITTLRKNTDSTFDLVQVNDHGLLSVRPSSSEIDEKLKFDNLFELGTSLVKALPKMSWEESMDVDKDGLWTWITAIYFDQLHKPTKVKKCNGELWYFIPEPSFQTYYRHKVRLAYSLTADDRMVPGFAEWLLKNQNAMEFGDVLENTVGYLQNLRNPALQDFILAHYRDEHGGIKKNTSSKWKGTKNPEKIKGNLRRFNISLKRLGTVADVEEMKVAQIGNLWGPEYYASGFETT